MVGRGGPDGAHLLSAHASRAPRARRADRALPPGGGSAKGRAVQARRPSLALVGAIAAFTASAVGCDVRLTSGAKVTLRYTDDARRAYDEAMASFRAKAWEDAKILFGDVKRMFPYTQYAKLAELRLGDCEFEQGKYADAVSVYREYERSHKNDKDIEYARYRLAKALFLDYDATFLLPSLEERDLSTTNESLKELRSFQKNYPYSRYIDDVRYMTEVASQRMVRHELYVARYYAGRDNFEAAIARCDYAIAKFPGSGMEPESLVLKGETFLKWKKPAEAQVAFERVVTQYGEPFATTARRFLEQMGVKVTAPANNAEPPARPAAPEPK